MHSFSNNGIVHDLYCLFWFTNSFLLWFYVDIYFYKFFKVNLFVYSQGQAFQFAAG